MRSTYGGGGLTRVFAAGLVLSLVAGGSSRGDDNEAQAKKEKAAKVVEEKKAAVKKAAEKAADAVGEAVGNLVEGLFLGGQAEAVEAGAMIQVIDAAVGGNADPFDQQVRPILTSVLNSELHFIR